MAYLLKQHGFQEEGTDGSKGGVLCTRKCANTQIQKISGMKGDLPGGCNREGRLAGVQDVKVGIGPPRGGWVNFEQVAIAQA